MRSSKYQSGMSVIGWLFMLLIIGSVVSVGVKVLPMYLDHNTMAGIFDDLAAENGLADKSNRQLRVMILKRLKLNNIRDFSVDDNVKFVRTKNGTDVIMDYELRVPLVSNLDLIASFDKQIELRR